MAVPHLLPNDPVEAQVAVMNVPLQEVPCARDFATHVHLNVLVTVVFGQSGGVSHGRINQLRGRGLTVQAPVDNIPRGRCTQQADSREGRELENLECRECRDLP